MKDWAWQCSGHFAEEGAVAVIGTELEDPFWAYLSLSSTLPFVQSTQLVITCFSLSSVFTRILPLDGFTT